MARWFGAQGQVTSAKKAREPATIVTIHLQETTNTKMFFF